MCGIYAYKGEKYDGAQIVFQGLKALEYRGYDSFGIFYKKDIKNNLYKYVGKVSDESNQKYFIDNKFKSNLALGHTRWATHGAVNKKNTHPHFSSTKRFAIVHNGVFENYNFYKKSLMKKGIKFNSDTDSEVIVNLIEERIVKGETLYNASKKVLKEIEGSNAFIVIDIQTENVCAARNGSALYVGLDKNDFHISSDANAILPYTKFLYTLSDSEVIDMNHLDKLIFEKVSREKSEVELSHYTHYMIKEIYEQAYTTENAYNINSLALNKLKNKNIIFTGCGSAYHVSLFGVILTSKLGIFSNAISADEFDSYKNLINKNTILFAISQSGETADTILAAKIVKQKGGEVISIINNKYSTLAQLSNKVLYINSGTEISVASTKAVSAQLATLIKIFTKEKISKKDWEEFSQFILDKSLEDKIKRLVDKIYKNKNLYIIGKNLSVPIGREIALKIKETTYIHAESFGAGELKHGVISLIEKGINVLVLDSDANYIKDIENSATQIKSRKGNILGIGSFPNQLYSDYLTIKLNKNLTPLAINIIGQKLSFYISIKKGINPDKPRNLAKSVTVR